ncbi:hypothetical protein AX15_003209 [Amanita polypyramis BW_CC]|nr:hypothetical protein AX15_003209 [Amanita polypyramis BW_CC]
MALASTEIQQYSQELAAYTFQQFLLARRMLEQTNPSKCSPVHADKASNAQGEQSAHARDLT